MSAPQAVHFLYNASDPSRNAPDYQNIWCACRQRFGTDREAAAAHITEVNGPDRWQALRDWLGSLQFAMYPQDVLARMTELEAGND